MSPGNNNGSNNDGPSPREPSPIPYGLIALGFSLYAGYAKLAELALAARFVRDCDPPLGLRNGS